MSQTRYRFSNGISGFFEFPTEAARRILPPHLEPVEPHHGTSVFQMTGFDFTESEVGAYGEVVMYSGKIRTAGRSKAPSNLWTGFRGKT